MNAIILAALFFLPTLAAQANEAHATEWQDTVISEATIKKIQAAGYQYKKCVADALKQPALQAQDSRHATDQAIKGCEPVLADMRAVYLAEQVPATIADRHLKQMRTKVTRDALQALMFAEAARNGGQ